MPKESYVWKYAVEINCTEAKCKICDAIIKRKSNTSNISKHIQIHHQSVYIQEKKLVPKTQSQISLQQDRVGFQQAQDDDEDVLNIPVSILFMTEYGRCFYYGLVTILFYAD